MKAQIDKAGRIVLPKPVRDRLGLRAGSSIEFEVISDGIVLKVPLQEPAMIQKHGLWVHLGQLPSGLNLTASLKDERESRLRRVASGV